MSYCKAPAMEGEGERLMYNRLVAPSKDLCFIFSTLTIITAVARRKTTPKMMDCMIANWLKGDSGCDDCGKKSTIIVTVCVCVG